MPRGLGQILGEMKASVEAFGFLGDDQVPVELDRLPEIHIQHALRHLHVEGRCVKNVNGEFCDLPDSGGSPGKG